VKDNYPIVIFWSDADEAYIADVPDLRYCSAHGETPEEALREILIARELWLETAREDGLPLPDPELSPYLPEIARKPQPVEAGASS
jgi:predicted RNase H-like HicB family nuclease